MVKKLFPVLIVLGFLGFFIVSIINSFVGGLNNSINHVNVGIRSDIESLSNDVDDFTFMNSNTNKVIYSETKNLGKTVMNSLLYIIVFLVIMMIIVVNRI